MEVERGDRGEGLRGGVGGWMEGRGLVDGWRGEGWWRGLVDGGEYGRLGMVLRAAEGF